MPNYSFPNLVVKAAAFDHYIRTNVSWASVFGGIVTDPMTIVSQRELTPEEYTELETLVSNYVDPAVFLSLNNTFSYPLLSSHNTNPENVIIDDLSVLQTFIFNSASNNNDGLVMDSCKTVVEYLVEENFSGTTAPITLQIFDVTRNTPIATSTFTVDLPAGPQTFFKTHTFYGINSNTTNYDCILQIRASSSTTGFSFRLNGWQYLFYNVE